MKKKVLAFDFGASSGRAMLGSCDGEKLELEEIHRFSNDPVMLRGTLYWDVLRLFHEIKTGITKAVQKGGFDAVGIDTWGVDFGLLDEKGRLLQNPVHYRDARTEGVPEQVFSAISKEEIYSRTGNQFMRINTLYQLAALQKQEPDLLKHTRRILMTPDLFAYFLTGEQRSEVTIASTSNLYNSADRSWDIKLAEQAGIPSDIFPPLISSGEIYGSLSPEICEELGCPAVPVIAVCTHDTASAVLSVPALEEQPDFIYISCGTWSLFGTELSAPLMTPEAERANFTNEVGVNHTIRFLKNIIGLWLIQESRRQWIREGEDVSFNQLEQEALAAEPFRSFIDPDDPRFEKPGNLPKRICEFCQSSGQPVPQNRGEIMRCIYQSMALKYKLTFEDICRLTGKKYPAIHMLGGGIKDRLLCRLTASACGVPVLAGPVEATVTGNVLRQMMTLGVIPDLAAARALVRASTPIETYPAPDASEGALWTEAFQRFRQALAL